MSSYDDWKTDPEYGLTHRDLREAERKQQESDEAALAICRKWVARLGGGFHPDTRGDDYFPQLSDEWIVEYENDMDELFRGNGDPYEFSLIAMKEIMS